MDSLSYTNISNISIFSNFLDSSFKTINDYFIDSKIIINNDDDFNSKTKKILLKYKRVIGIVLLIILLIIGYYEYKCNCNEYNNENINGKINKKTYKNMHNGGADEVMYGSESQALANIKAKAESAKHLEAAKKTHAEETKQKEIASKKKRV